MSIWGCMLFGILFFAAIFPLLCLLRRLFFWACDMDEKREYRREQREYRKNYLKYLDEKYPNLKETDD